MSNNGYGKENEQYNMYNDYDNFFDQNNYYTDNDNYIKPLEANDLQNGNMYNSTSWEDFDQGRNQNNRFDSYMDNEYNYYGGNYSYDDKYSIDYSNSSTNYMDYGYDYSQYDSSYFEDSTLYDISSKINANIEQEMLYDSFENKYRDSQINYENDNSNYNDYNNNYNNDYNNDYDNKTVAMNVNSNMGNNGGPRNVNNSVYGGIDTDSGYFQRNGAYDNRLIPTEDIVFDDAYVVRNQLFEDEEKLFSFNDIVSFAICIVFAVIMAFLILRYVAQQTKVDGHSMEFNLHDRDILLLDKLTYSLKDPERYDIVVFPHEDDGYYIKRVIGLPGEKVYVDTEKNELYINGKKRVDEIYGWEDYNSSNKTVNKNNITLKKDEYYVMGDNRNNSHDSRAFGPVKRGDIIAKAIFKLYPIKSIGLIDSKINDRIYKGETELKGDIVF